MIRKTMLVLLMAFALGSYAQKRNAANSLSTAVGEPGASNNFNIGENNFKIVSARKVMEVKIPEGGANGASVVYHPKEKLYYAAP